MLTDFITDALSDLLPDAPADRRAPRWVWFLLAAVSLGFAAFFWFAMEQSPWTWAAASVAAIFLLAGIAGA
jgi:hypothetical protein